MVRAGDEAEQQSQVNILKDSILEAKKRYASKDTDTTYFTPDTPVPYSPPLEKAFRPNSESIREAVLRSAAY